MLQNIQTSNKKAHSIHSGVPNTCISLLKKYSFIKQKKIFWAVRLLTERINKDTLGTRGTSLANLIS